jgi:hypothetical protein
MRTDRLAPVDIVFSIGRRMLDKHPFKHVVALRAAQEIVHVCVDSLRCCLALDTHAGLQRDCCRRVCRRS